jgi:ribosomal protein S18 acetylase RimI-like enzyme
MRLEIEEGKTLVLSIPDDLERAYPVIHELRTLVDFAEFERLTKLAAAADGYKLVGREVRGDIVAVMGYRILHDLVHGSHLYVDDLSTLPEHRGYGHGAELLRFAEGEARRLGLAGLRLCTGVGNVDAKRFYEREGWEVRAHAFKKKMTSH